MRHGKPSEGEKRTAKGALLVFLGITAGGRVIVGLFGLLVH